jgi:hypothetical protein
MKGRGAASRGNNSYTTYTKKRLVRHRQLLY